jgi:hypothetical protein
MIRNVMAVTGAALLTRKDIWMKVGGMNPDFPLNLNDIDYCLKVRQAGYPVLMIPASKLIHLESRSRYDSLTARDWKTTSQELSSLIDIYNLEGEDPFYSPHLTQSNWDLKLRTEQNPDKILQRMVQSGKYTISL